MTYNNGFPMGYQTMNYSNPNTNSAYPMQNSQTNNGIIWVQGEASAKSHLVAAGTSALLMDSEDTKFYIKSTDQSGMPLPLRTFKYEEITTDVHTSPNLSSNATLDTSKFVTFEALENRLQQILKQNNDIVENGVENNG